MRRDADILLIQQQGPDDPSPHWALPGGRVEQGETLVDALIREVREETGLTVQTVGRPIYITQIDNPNAPVRSTGEIPAPGDSATIFVFDVTEFSGALQPKDPDGLVFGIGFFSRADAIERLERLPWRVMREPIVHALRGDAIAGTLWVYRRTSDGGDALIARLPAPVVSQTESADAKARTSDPRMERQHSLMVLGCMAIVVLFVVLVIVGFVAVAHPHF
jgi:8-oxo-dGTP diphosphatase